MNVGFAPIGAPNGGLGPFFKNRGGFGSLAFNLSYAQSVENLDAIVLWGGADISPSLYNEKPIDGSGPEQPSPRDLFEWECIRLAVKRGIPIIGVCRGAQLLCAYAGGKLVQDVNNHTGHHHIKTHDDKEFWITSCHHQMMVPGEAEHQVLGWCNHQVATRFSPKIPEYDKLVSGEHKEPEVIYFPAIRGYGIQCHPEWHASGDRFNEWVMQSIQDKCFKD